MKEKILTISIAAYNMEKYIRQALDSLMDERIIDELEIFVIDDGGTDKTLDIVKEYAKKYPNSVFPVHKENGGYGTTVNYSIAHATGKYFKLLDGDDWFDRDGLYELVTYLRGSSVDLIITKLRKIRGLRSEVVEIKMARWGELASIESIGQANSFPMWSIAYRTIVLKNSGLELPAHTLYTDGIYDTIPVACCETIFYLDQCVYNYRLGRDGQSVAAGSIIKHADDYFRVAMEIGNYYEAHKRSDGVTDYIRRKAARNYNAAIKAKLCAPYSKENLHAIKIYEMELKRIHPDIFVECDRNGKRGKFIRILRMTDYHLYWIVHILFKFNFREK